MSSSTDWRFLSQELLQAPPFSQTPHTHCCDTPLQESQTLVLLIQRKGEGGQAWRGRAEEPNWMTSLFC